LPIHSPDRYEMEIQSYRLKKESYMRQKEIEEKEKEMKEKEEYSKNAITKPDQKLDLHAFYQKYNNQVKVWENKKRAAGEESREREK